MHAVVFLVVVGWAIPVVNEEQDPLETHWFIEVCLHTTFVTDPEVIRQTVRKQKNNFQTSFQSVGSDHSVCTAIGNTAFVTDQELIRRKGNAKR